MEEVGVKIARVWLAEWKTRFFTQNPSSFNTLLVSAVCVEASAEFPSLWSRSTCGSSWGLWGGMLIIINSAGLPPFLPPDSWKAPSGGGEVTLACCCVKAAAKLNKQRRLFVMKTRDESRGHSRCFDVQVLREQAFVCRTLEFKSCLSHE